jgi:hypothetical protein
MRDCCCKTNYSSWATETSRFMLDLWMKMEIKILSIVCSDVAPIMLSHAG